MARLPPAARALHLRGPPRSRRRALHGFGFRVPRRAPAVALAPIQAQHSGRVSPSRRLFEKGCAGTSDGPPGMPERALASCQRIDAAGSRLTIPIASAGAAVQSNEVYPPPCTVPFSNASAASDKRYPLGLTTHATGRSRLKSPLLAVILFVAAASQSHAADRNEKVKELMQAQGLVETFEQQLASGRVQGREQANQMLAQMLNGLNPEPKYRARFTEAADEFIRALEPPWGAKEIVDIWSKYYGSQFTEAELDQLLAYYTSPLAQKEVGVSRKALAQFSRHFVEQYKPITEAAMAKYVERLQKIAKECNCAR